jgi:hypothetical protein
LTKDYSIRYLVGRLAKAQHWAGKAEAHFYERLHEFLRRADE